MGNVRYQLSGEKSDEKNVKLLYVSSAVYEGDWPSIRHTHYFSELFYVKSGRGNFVVGNYTFPVAEDDLVIINPNVEHTELSVGSSPLEYVVLGIEGMQFAFDESETGDHAISNYYEQRKELLFYFDIMLREIENKPSNHETICQKLLDILLIILMRGSSSSFSVVPSQKVSKEFIQIKRHINSNYADEITLDSLAEMSHLSKFYLVHAFTNFYGLSPITYLNGVRIQSSKELLESTDLSILEIAQSTGFSSQSYFSQSFRKSCGQTPGNYRRIMRKK